MTSIRLALFLALSPLAGATGDTWLSDVSEARKQAAESGKWVLVLFTGSNWSGPCIEMEREVFRRDNFVKGVSKKLVLSRIDIPQDESTLPDDQLLQANSLQEAYRVDGYPTVILTDAEGRPFAKTGYLDGDAMKYLSHINTLLAQKGAFDGMMSEAIPLEGGAKARKLAQALRSLELPETYLIEFYTDTIAEIDRNDPEQTLPLLQSLKAAKQFFEWEQRVDFLIEEEKMDEALKLAERGTGEKSFDAEKRQQFHFFKTVVHMEAGRYDEALKSLEECRQLAPESETARSLDILKSHLKTLQEEADAAIDPEDETKEPSALDEGP